MFVTSFFNNDPKTFSGSILITLYPSAQLTTTSTLPLDNCVVASTEDLHGADMQPWSPTTYPGLPSRMNGWSRMNLLYNYGWNTAANNWDTVKKFWFSESYDWVRVGTVEPD